MKATIERGIGRALRSYRVRDRHLVWNDPRTAAPDTIHLTSTAFADGAAMPERYAASDGAHDISPPLGWSNLPGETAELVLIIQDTDAPLPRPVVHLIAMVLPCNWWAGLPEGALSLTAGGDSHARRAGSSRSLPGQACPNASEGSLLRAD